MISRDNLIEKKNYYNSKINELNNMDINLEVEKRLNELRDEITKKVVEDFSKDVLKCQHYIEIIDIMLNEDNGGEQ